MEIENPGHSGGGQPTPAASDPTPPTTPAPPDGQPVWQRPTEPGPTPTQPWTPGPVPAGPWAATASAVPVWHTADPTAPHAATVIDAPVARRPGRLTRWLAAGAAGLALVAGAGVAGGVAAHALSGGTSAASGTTATAVAAKASNGTVTLADLVSAVRPSVVTITATSGNGTAEGSGVVVRSDGMIVTNNHVVSGATGTITVAFSDGTTGTATVVAADTTGDLALLKVAGVSGLTAISVGDSSRLAVGDCVVAIGNPLGLGISVSEGIVSALNRQVTIDGSNSSDPGFRQQRGSSSAATVNYSGAIQTDAAVNEGNSGGALINTSGQLVGITSAIATDGTSTGNLGVAFAIPSSQVSSFVARALG